MTTTPGPRTALCGQVCGIPREYHRNEEHPFREAEARADVDGLAQAWDKTWRASVVSVGAASVAVDINAWNDLANAILALLAKTGAPR